MNTQTIQFNYFVDTLAGKDGYIQLYYNADVQILIPRGSTCCYLHFEEYPNIPGHLKGVVEHFDTIEECSDFLDRIYRLELID